MEEVAGEHRPQVPLGQEQAKDLAKHPAPKRDIQSLLVTFDALNVQHTDQQ